MKVSELISHIYHYYHRGFSLGIFTLGLLRTVLMTASGKLATLWAVDWT